MGRLVIISTDFPPIKTSAAVQLGHLSGALYKLGHHVTVIVPTENLPSPYQIQKVEGIHILRLSCGRIKNISYIRRLIGEITMPLLMLYGLYRSQYKVKSINGIICYSPPIFFGLFISVIKKISSARCYLILRDIFPGWAFDLGLIRNRLILNFLQFFANFQYSVSDVIGVQSKSNLKYLRGSVPGKARLEVLHNWLDKEGLMGSSINIALTPLAGRKIFVYTGNMGAAQDLEIFIHLAKGLLHNETIGFIFVGRGNDFERLKALANALELNNILFFDEINSHEIPSLLKQCAYGLLGLDLRHRTHNIPGKFLSYMRAGLPVLARCGKDSDLAKLIRVENVGFVCAESEDEDLILSLHALLAAEHQVMAANAIALFAARYRSEIAASQIIEGLELQ